MKKFHSVALRLVLFVALFVSWNILPACGGPSFDNPGVDKNKKISELSAAEIKTLNELVKTIIFTEENKKNICNFTGVFTASMMAAMMKDAAKLKKACTDAQNKCLNNSENSGQSELEKKKDKCEATVGEWAECMKARQVQFEKMIEAAAKYSCDNLPKEGDKLKDKDGNEIKMDGELPECKTFNEKCK